MYLLARVIPEKTLYILHRGLYVSGTALSAAGGLTSIGAEIAIEVLTSDLKKKANRISENFNQIILQIGETLENIERETRRFPASAFAQNAIIDLNFMHSNLSHFRIIINGINGAKIFAKAVEHIVKTALKLVGETWMKLVSVVQLLGELCLGWQPEQPPNVFTCSEAPLELPPFRSTLMPWSSIRYRSTKMNHTRCQVSSESMPKICVIVAEKEKTMLFCWIVG